MLLDGLKLELGLILLLLELEGEGDELLLELGEILLEGL